VKNVSVYLWSRYFDISWNRIYFTNYKMKAKPVIDVSDDNGERTTKIA